jgi:hypothetical protein
MVRPTTAFCTADRWMLERVNPCRTSQFGLEVYDAVWQNESASSRVRMGITNACSPDQTEAARVLRCSTAWSKLNGIDPVLSRIADHPINIEELLPWNLTGEPAETSSQAA